MHRRILKYNKSVGEKMDTINFTVDASGRSNYSIKIETDSYEFYEEIMRVVNECARISMKTEANKSLGGPKDGEK